MSARNRRVARCNGPCPPATHAARPSTRTACLLAAALFASLLAPAIAHAGAIWTDANGDGLPDAPGTLVASTGDIVSVDVWIDSQSFSWTNFLVYAEWTPGRFQFLTGEYLLTSGENFPLDTFSHPSGVGFGGILYERQGIDAMARIVLRVLSGGVCCVTPIIDIENPYYVFSQLGRGEDYFVFTSNPNSCWTVPAAPEACCFADETCAMLAPVECIAAGGTPQGFGTDCASVACEPTPPRGACCMPSGSCTGPVTAPECGAIGGVYQGNGTDCATVACPVPSGACCYPSGACEGPISAMDCATGGGSYQGNGTDCATVDCPVTIGACCFANGTCTGPMNAAECAASGGSYQGNGTDCATVDCPVTIGACCLPNGTCDGPVTAQQCATFGGVYQGNGTDCATVVCPQPIGACCYPSGACEGPISAAECAAGGGSYRGNGTDCATVNCPVTIGACCYPDRTCEGPISAAVCAARGGLYQGNGTDCATITCPPQGACCFMTPHACRIRTAAQCAAEGGTYLGDDTVCSPDPCPFPPGPTGACCVDGTCIGTLTRAACDAAGGVYRGDGTTCAMPGICEIPTGCSGAPLSSTMSVFLMRESAGDERGSASQTAPCALASSTNGTAANYRWYNICSGYIWMYSGLAQGEGVGVQFGGWQQPAVNGDNDVKRVITYFRNVLANYAQTVDVYLDTDINGDGCPDQILASALDLDPGLRWNCSEFNASFPCGVNYLIVRTVHDGGAAPSFATDGPFTSTCDPNAPGRSFYYGINSSACTPWCGPDNSYDNFLYWLILDYSAPCVTSVEPTTWGRIKGMFR